MGGHRMMCEAIAECGLRQTLLLAVAFALAAVNMLPCAAQPPLEFEVASIKPAPPGPRNTTTEFEPGGRFRAVGAPLRALIQVAYAVQDFQVVGGPGWADSEPYDVVAKPAAGVTLDRNQVKMAIQALLVSRFQLKIHRATKDLPIYSLVVGKNGPKLAKNIDEPGPGATMGPGQLKGSKISMSILAAMLAQLLDFTVRNDTGISGDFDVKLTWTPGQAAEIDGPSIFTALQEELGLKLNARKGPVEIIIIDSAERPSAN
jgi:uncharacterized protein (TIGR03435 family)